jgi:hypothetical protein
MSENSMKHEFDVRNYCIYCKFSRAVIVDENTPECWQREHDARYRKLAEALIKEAVAQ